MMKALPNFPIGAVEVIVEAQAILAGKRDTFTDLDAYTAQRRRYWEMQAQRPRRHRAALPRKAAA